MRSYEGTIAVQGGALALSVLSLPFAANPALFDQRNRDTLLASVLGPTWNTSPGFHILDLAAARAAPDYLPRIWLSSRAGEREPSESLAVELFDLFLLAYQQDFIPLERSPISGESLGDAVKNATYLGIAAELEQYGYQHHDPIIMITTPFALILASVVVGAANGIEQRVKRWFDDTSSKQKQEKRSKKSRKHR